MTTGMLAIAAATTLYWRHTGDDIIDPRDWLGANASNLAQHLLTTGGCYEFGAAAIHSAWGDHHLKYWRIASTAAALGLAVTYRIGAQWNTPTEEFGLSDTPSIIHDWILLSVICTAFVLVVIAARRTAHDAGGRWVSITCMYLLGFLGAGCPAMIAVLMVADPEMVHRGYHDLVASWTTAALIALSIAGVPGLLDGWWRRADPS